MFVRRAYIPDALQPKDYRAWPFTVPCVAEVAAHGLEFTLPRTAMRFHLAVCGLGLGLGERAGLPPLLL